MASIKDAYQCTIGENFTGLKIILWAIPMFWFRNIITADKLNFASILTFGIIFAIILFGYMIEVSHNTITHKDGIVPGANLIKMFFDGFKGSIALIIYAIISFVGAKFICSIINTGSATLDMTFHIMVWFIMLGVFYSGYMIYIRRLNAIEVFNPAKIFLAYPEAFVSGAYMVVKLAVFNIPFIGFVNYMFWLFLGLDNYLIKFIWAVIIMYNLTISANYLAQLSEEIFAFQENKEAQSHS